MRALLASMLSIAVATLWCGCDGSVIGATSPSGDAPGAPSGNQGSPAPSPSGAEATNCTEPTPVKRVMIQRLTTADYLRSAKDLLFLPASVQPSGVFPSDTYDDDTFSNDASRLTVSEQLVDLYFTTARELAVEAMKAPAAGLINCSLANPGCPEATLEKVAARAYRRPLEASDRDGLMAVYRSALAQGTTAAMTRALQAVLVSPFFLYRSFAETTPDDPNSTHQLDSYELASRLSYFLWGTLPDAELSTLAASGALQNPAELDRQVTRMLADPRAVALVDNFAEQWLPFGEVENASRDSTQFPSFNASLRSALHEETRQFFANLIRDDRPLNELVLADYSFLNTQLAQHYGVMATTGTGFAKVSMPASAHRRGVLTHGSVLTVSSGSTLRTAPVVRGYWVLARALCSEPPPPPGNVIPLQQTDGAQKTVKEQLSQHRTDPACAGCHQLMDPIGLGFENYDPIGAWRTTYPDGQAVDARGELPGGASFDGPEQLLAELAAQPKLQQCMTQKLLSYAVGRRMSGTDRCGAQRLANTLGPVSRVSDLVKAVVKSQYFVSNQGGAQ